MIEFEGSSIQFEGFPIEFCYFSVDFCVSPKRLRRNVMINSHNDFYNSKKESTILKGNDGKMKPKIRFFPALPRRKKPSNQKTPELYFFLKNPRIFSCGSGVSLEK